MERHGPCKIDGECSEPEVKSYNLTRFSGQAVPLPLRKNFPKSHGTVGDFDVWVSATSMTLFTDSVVSFFSDILLGVLTSISIAALYYVGRLIYDILFGNIPPVGGRWNTAYAYIDASGKEVEANEIANVSTFGRRISSNNTMKGPPNRDWKLTGHFSRRYWAGKVVPSDKKSLSGSGVFQLKIWEDGKTMEGHMIWYDGKMDKTYATAYKWNKAEKGN